MWAKSLRSKPHLPQLMKNQIRGERPDVVQGVFILGGKIPNVNL